MHSVAFLHQGEKAKSVSAKRPNVFRGQKAKSVRTLRSGADRSADPAVCQWLERQKPAGALDELGIPLADLIGALEPGPLERILTAARALSGHFLLMLASNLEALPMHTDSVVQQQGRNGLHCGCWPGPLWWRRMNRPF